MAWEYPADYPASLSAQPEEHSKCSRSWLGQAMVLQVSCSQRSSVRMYNGENCLQEHFPLLREA